MKINALNILNLNYKTKINLKNPCHTTNPFKALNKDTVSFSGKLRRFQNENNAIEYFSKIAKKVNGSLNQDDDLTAFETLGYDVDSDFDTDEITINGDYKPYFEFTYKKQLKTIPYADLGINEEKLLKNVRKITGKTYPCSEFEPDSDFKINILIIYPEKTRIKLLEILKEKAKKVNEALKNNQDEEAFKILGYETQKNEDGKITILGDYNTELLKTPHHIITMRDVGVNENELFRNVTRITNSGRFTRDFIPDHYIQSLHIYYRGESGAVNKLGNLMMKFRPDFIEKSNQTRELCKNGDYQQAILLVCPSARIGNDGKINIDDNFDMRFNYKLYWNRDKMPLKEMGFDEKTLLEHIGTIKGNLDLSKSDVDILPPNMTIKGRVYKKDSIDDKEFFKNYISLSDFSKIYKNIPAKVFSNYIESAHIKHAIRTDKDYYLSPEEIKNNPFIQSITERKDEILTSQELMETFGISSSDLSSALFCGKLKPYKKYIISGIDCWEAGNFLYDIADESNSKAIAEFKKKRTKQQLTSYKNLIKNNRFIEACLKHSTTAQTQRYNAKSYPQRNLEKLGYGSKADLIANCSLRMNAYEIKKYILDNNTYDTTTTYMMDTLIRSRENNPSIIKLSKLIKLLDKNLKDFADGVFEGKLDVITDIPYCLTYPKDYCIDVSTPKNLEFLRSIDNKDFQNWLNEAIRAKDEYTKKNAQAMLEFQHTSKPTYQERLKDIKRQFDDIEKTRALQQLDLLNKKNAIRKSMSLRNTIAWYLCPKTRQIKRDFSNSKIHEILERKKEIKDITEQLLAGEIQFKEAKEKIAKLQLSQEDAISVLAYHKLCWETSGTQEWKQALADAKVIMEKYEHFGLEAIEDDELKQRLAEWETKWVNQ